MPPEQLTTKMTNKGQIILPKAVRERRKWVPGTQLVVEETPEGVLLRSVSALKPSRHEDVAGMLAYKGHPKTIDEMDAGIEAEIKRRHARGRY